MVQMQLSDHERKILQTVADLSGAVGFAADSEVADETGLDLQTIQAALDAFERRGLIRSANSFDGRAARLTGEGRLTLNAEITDEESALLTTISAMQPDSRFFVADTDIAARASMALQRVHDLLDRLEGKGLVRLAKSFDGYSAAITGEPDPMRPGFGEYRLKDRGVPIWAIIGSLTEDADNVDDVAEAYGLPREAVEAALAFYRRHHAAIDARLAQNIAS